MDVRFGATTERVRTSFQRPGPAVGVSAAGPACGSALRSPAADVPKPPVDGPLPARTPEASACGPNPSANGSGGRVGSLQAAKSLGFLARLLRLSALLWVGTVAFATLPAAGLATGCIGDCNRDGTVTVDELVLGTRISLGQTVINFCRALDVDNDGKVTIDELLTAVENTIHGCPTPPFTPTPSITSTAAVVLTATQTPTASTTATPTVTPTPTSFGPQITFFGLASPDNLVYTPSAVDEHGNPVYDRLAGLGAGFFIVVEATSGSSLQPLGTSNANSDVNSPPDLQIEANKDLGNGSAAICDAPGPNATQTPGGVPAIPTPNFDQQSPQIANTLNDFGCRFSLRSPIDACTKDPTTEAPRFVSSDSSSQFCTAGAVGRELEFPSGDTLLTVRWRDMAGNLGNPASIVVHLP